MVKKLDTAPYKGVRDFYPEDMWLLKYLFKVLRTEVERFGYVEYGASILEPAELYRAKSGEEIVNDQTYTFTDRGDREVTLRPEMTPTVARMVAGRKRELPFPLRWYSLPNLFRYENPQRGRLREHYQLNVDFFGVADQSADIEIIQLASNILKAFGATENDFIIQLNSRPLMNKLFASFHLDDESSHNLSKILDKKEKVSVDEFKKMVEEILGDDTALFITLLDSKEKLLDRIGEEEDSVKALLSLLDTLSELGIKNAVFTPSLQRGLDYYTDIVFEVFDTHPDNKRSLFGGGRYNDLLALFGGDTVPAVGFGMGDVTLIQFLEMHDLLPPYKPETKAVLVPIGSVSPSEIAKLALRLRNEGLNIAINQNAKKPADTIKAALKAKIPFMIFVGEDELAQKTYTFKDLIAEETRSLSEEELIRALHA